jgi:hypothetical protein
VLEAGARELEKQRGPMPEWRLIMMTHASSEQHVFLCNSACSLQYSPPLPSITPQHPAPGSPSLMPSCCMAECSCCSAKPTLFS